LVQVAGALAVITHFYFVDAFQAIPAIHRASNLPHPIKNEIHLPALPSRPAMQL
jgi:hypothetical protein